MRHIRFRGLVKRYFIVLFAAVVAPLVVSGAGEAWFGYRDQRARLDQLLTLQAKSAAERIGGFVNDLANELNWPLQLPWTDLPDDTRRTDALRLMRQAPAIASLTLVDGEGRERIHVSRIGLNRTESRIDLSADPDVAGALSHRTWFSEVSYNRGSEPHMTIAVSGNRRSLGVAVAEVNLKLIWDVVSSISVGETGFAFVLDHRGRLIAHPDISLVLRGAEEKTVRPFRRVRDDAVRAAGGFATSQDGDGGMVAAAAATVAGPGWAVVVEQPLSEAFRPIYAALRRTAILVILGAAFAAGLAYWLAGHMTGPIRLLEDGARRIGAGEFGHRISIKTGDELQDLAQQFNVMAAELAISQERQERITNLRRFLAPQVAELVDRAGHHAVLEGRHTEVVVLFCDIRNFTAFSAKSAPEDVMRVLSEYYDALGRAIVKFEATLISYSGDGLMVLINAPVPTSDPAHRGVALALEMQSAVQKLLARWSARGEAIGFGVGVCMGPATVGQIGFESRLDYTAIGPVVNLAARLCSAAADRTILMNRALAEAVTDAHRVDALGAIPIKGYEENVQVFRIVADASRPLDMPA